MNADFHKFITECLGLLTENIDCSYIFLPGFYEMCNLLVRRSDFPKDYQNGRIQEMRKAVNASPQHAKLEWCGEHTTTLFLGDLLY
jgi:hypothetical protein